MNFYIFDILGAYCGMHYYDMAFADVLRERGHKVDILSNFSEKQDSKPYLPNFFQCGKITGILRLLCAYFTFFKLIIGRKSATVIYLTYGELYELPFLLLSTLSRNVYVDVHEIHALKYRDTSKVSKLFEVIYRKYIHHVIYHSQRTYDILKNDRLNMLYVPHFKYVFQRTFDVGKLADEVKDCFCSSAPKFLFFGNLSTVKGIDTVMDVFGDLSSTEVFELVVAGKNVEDIDFSAFQNEKIKVIDRHINDDELVYLYAKTDFVLLPYKKSSQSGIFAMAAYFHKPMLLSAIPYFKQMLQEYPSFGEICSLGHFKECVFDAIHKEQSSYYSQADCERFEMKTEIDNFVEKLIKSK